MNYKLLNGSNLAYIGDAYYELVVRQHLLNLNVTKNKDLKKLNIKYVSANAHMKIYTQIQDRLTEEERNIYLRGRNNAPHGYRKNVDKTAYLVSTGFEAIIGYLYLAKNYQRLDEIMALALAVIEKEES